MLPLLGADMRTEARGPALVMGKEVVMEGCVVASPYRPIAVRSLVMACVAKALG